MMNLDEELKKAEAEAAESNHIFRVAIARARLYKMRNHPGTKGHERWSRIAKALEEAIDSEDP